MNLNRFFERARHSSFHRWLLNRGLLRIVPFNSPHRFTVEEIEDYRVKISMPYIRKNLNHIRGLHACGLATLSEYASGLLLLSRLGMENYRIIMQRLEMDYHYQGKMAAAADFSLNQQFIDEHITGPLADRESVIITCVVNVHDAAGNHLSTGKVFWQIKKWTAVKTRIAN